MPVIHAMSDLNTPALRHKFFKYACQAMEPNNHVFYYCVQQYNAAPNKRKAIFIFDTFLKEILDTGPAAATVGTSMDAAYNLLRQVNVYNTGQWAGEISGINTVVGNIKKVKSWAGKLWNRGLVAQYRNPRAGLFAAAQKQIEDVMKNDWFLSFDTNTDSQIPARYPPKIQTASQVMAQLGFNPDDMGVY